MEAILFAISEVSRHALTNPSARKIRQSTTNLRRDAPIDSCRMQKDARRVTARSETRRCGSDILPCPSRSVSINSARVGKPGSPSISKHEKSINVRLHRQQITYSRLSLCTLFFLYRKNKIHHRLSDFPTFLLLNSLTNSELMFFSKDFIKHTSLRVLYIIFKYLNVFVLLN